MSPITTTQEAHLSVGLIGLGKISKWHLKAVAEADGVRLAGVCDLDPERVRAVGAAAGVPGFADFREMIRSVRPDIAVIATETGSHARLTCACAALGVRAIHCEKPMAVHLADARAMVEACRANGVLLTINHQRRMRDVAAARARIDAGVIGGLVELRGYCAGDFLSDGTHLVDSLLALAGDGPVESVIAGLDAGGLETRFGHPVEKGVQAVLNLGAGPRIELATGTCAQARAYQEYHVTGERGMLWRAGDILSPNWFIADGGPGDHALLFGRERWHWRPHPCADGGPWRALELRGTAGNSAVYTAIRHSLASGEPHPLDGARTLQVQQVITAVYRSGILRRPVALAELESVDHFPLLDPALAPLLEIHRKANTQ